MENVTGPIVLFDGVCNLCQGSIQFILTHERSDSTLRFASLQSETGRQLLAEHGLPADYFESLVYLESGKAYTASDGALRIARHLRWYLSWLTNGLVLPRAWRNGIYAWIGRNRYSWFGKKEACWLPEKRLQARFL